MCKNEIILLMSNEIAFKTHIFDKSTKNNEDGMCKFAIRNAGMKQDDIII